MRPTGTPAPTPNGAHTVAARARDTDNKTTLSTPVNVTVANSDNFQNEVLATGFDLPTAIEVPARRPAAAWRSWRARSWSCRRRTRPRTRPRSCRSPTSAPRASSRGSSTWRSTPISPTNHYYYVFYTAATPSADRLSRFTANSALTGTVPGSELVLYQDPQVPNIEHHGGAINFGNDGMIYFTTGDHFQGTPSQDLNSPRGKIHRIWPDGLVPTDNPFYDGSGPHWDSVWAYGLRNPYRAYYDRPTGRLFVGDVGGNGSQSSTRRWTSAPAARTTAGRTSKGHARRRAPAPSTATSTTGNGSAITGGFVYHGTQFPAGMQGNYFFADYSGRWIKRMAFDANGNFNGVFNFEPLTAATTPPATSST